jgi:hypothetical protein
MHSSEKLVLVLNVVAAALGLVGFALLVAWNNRADVLVNGILVLPGAIAGLLLLAAAFIAVLVKHPHDEHRPTFVSFFILSDVFFGVLAAVLLIIFTGLFAWGLVLCRDQYEGDEQEDRCNDPANLALVGLDFMWLGGLVNVAGVIALFTNIHDFQLADAGAPKHKHHMRFLQMHISERTVLIMTWCAALIDLIAVCFFAIVQSDATKVSRNEKGTKIDSSVSQDGWWLIAAGVHAGMIVFDAALITVLTFHKRDEHRNLLFSLYTCCNLVLALLAAIMLLVLTLDVGLFVSTCGYDPDDRTVDQVDTEWCSRQTGLGITGTCLLWVATCIDISSLAVMFAKQRSFRFDPDDPVETTSSSEEDLAYLAPAKRGKKGEVGTSW